MRLVLALSFIASLTNALVVPAASALTTGTRAVSRPIAMRCASLRMQVPGDSDPPPKSDFREFDSPPPKSDNFIAIFVAVSLGGYGLILVIDAIINGVCLPTFLPGVSTLFPNGACFGVAEQATGWGS